MMENRHIPRPGGGLILTPQNAELLLKANRILSSKLDTNALLEAVIELAAQVVNAEAASLLLLDAKTNELYFNVALGSSEKIKEVRLQVGEGLAGWVARHKEPALANDAAKDPRWSGKGDEKSEFKTREILAVPILHQEELLGVLEAINKKDPGGFTETDLSVLEAFASQTAVALKNSSLFAEVLGEKEKLATVFSEMSDGALLVDEAGVVRMMNAAAGRLFNAAPKEAVGSATIQHLTRDFAVLPPLETVHERAEKSAEIQFARRSGKTYYLSGHMNRLAGPGGDFRGYLMVVRDVTESRREEMLKKNFLSLISHKLKTPLVSILGYAPLLLKDPKGLTDFQKSGLSAINEQGAQLASLVDKLLAFSVVESENLSLSAKPVAIGAVVNEALAAMQSYLKKNGAAVELDAGFSSLPPVRADSSHTATVLKNLLENAVKFNPHEKKGVKISGRVDGSFVRVTVEDDGPGISVGEFEKIFQKFYQIEESFTGQVGGAGLGLPLAKRIVEAQGGAIGVESIPGRGCAFFFTLPAAGHAA